MQYLTIGRSTILLTDDAKPVLITLSGAPVAFQMRRFDSAGQGELESFKPTKGPVVIDATGQALSTSGTKLHPIKGGGKPPKTRALLAAKGGKVSVKLIAKGLPGCPGPTTGSAAEH